MHCGNYWLFICKYDYTIGQMQRVCSQSVGDYVGGRCEAGNQGDTLKAQHGFLLSSKWPKGIKSYAFWSKIKNIFKYF